MKKVGLISLGCDKNRVDSEYLLGLLDHFGYTLVSDPKDCDIIFINTCGFIESSKRESINTILEMLDYNKPVVILGCLAERYEKELKEEFKEATIIPIHDYRYLSSYLRNIDHDFCGSGGIDEKYRILSTAPYTAYLRIGEGCSNHCAYCAIPLIRGEYVSRKKEDIITEALKLKDQGVKEIVVLQQDTTKYGSDLNGQENIVSLLKSLLEIKEFEYIRLLYLYPDEISDELINLIKEEKRLTPYFDIPIQHSETKILKSMRRRGDKQFLIDLFKKIKETVPNAILRTTVMVGFPGETKKDVDNLIKFMEEVKFDHLGAFTYSREEDTLSYNMPHQVREKTKKERLDRVMKAQQKISYLNNKKHIGEIMEGLVVGFKDDKYLLRSYWNAPDDIDGNIYFSSDKKLAMGEKVKIKITNAFVYDLIGEKI